MGSGREALGLLVARIESHVPSRDPAIRYRLRSMDVATPEDRRFSVAETAALDLSTATMGDPVTLTLTVEVEYSERTERFAWLQDALEDAEDLTLRIGYYPGSEWAQSSGYGFRVTRREVTRGEVRLTVEAIYNISL